MCFSEAAAVQNSEIRKTGISGVTVSIFPQNYCNDCKTAIWRGEFYGGVWYCWINLSIIITLVWIFNNACNDIAF